MYGITLCTVIAISLLGNFKDALNVSEIYQKKISFYYVFSSNFKLMVGMSITGILTLCLSSLYTYCFNVISLGMITNSMILNGLGSWTLKMIPHGLIELFALTIAFMQPIFVYLYVLKDTKEVICKNTTLKQTILNYISFITVNELMITILLCIAGVVEYVVSYIQI